MMEHTGRRKVLYTPVKPMSKLFLISQVFVSSPTVIRGPGLFREEVLALSLPAGPRGQIRSESSWLVARLTRRHLTRHTWTR